MLRLLTLAACLLAAAAAQPPSYYCNSIPTSPIKDRDFYLTTRTNSGDVAYQAGLTCEFNAESSTGAFLVEIESFRVSTAVLTISSGASTLFRGSRLESYQSSITTPSKSLQVRFDASGDQSHSAGVRVRVRAFDINGCPTGWAYIAGTCFGTSNTSGRLDYFDAQRACNSMRSNLLHLPSGYSNNIAGFVSMLPARLKSTYTWIGLTDRTSAGRYNHYWLNGDRQFSTSEISCASNGNYLTCLSYERCGTINGDWFLYAIYMDNCSGAREFTCSSPPGGTSIFYRVPNGSSVIVVQTSYISGWVWGVLVAAVFVVGLVVVGVYSRVRSGNVPSSNMRRNPGASTVVSTVQITVPPPSTAYPAQRPLYPLPYPQQLQQYPTNKDLNAPPPYHTVAGSGYGNEGFQIS